MRVSLRASGAMVGVLLTVCWLYALPLYGQWEDVETEVIIGNPRKSNKKAIRAKERERIRGSGRVKRSSLPRTDAGAGRYKGGKVAEKVRRGGDVRRRPDKVKAHKIRPHRRESPQKVKNPRHYKSKRRVVKPVGRVVKHKRRKKEAKYVGNSRISSPKRLRRARIKRDKRYARLHRKVRRSGRVTSRQRERGKRRLRGVKKSPDPLTRSKSPHMRLVYSVFPPRTSRHGVDVPKGQRVRLPLPSYQKNVWQKGVIVLQDSLHRKRLVPVGQRGELPAPIYQKSPWQRRVVALRDTLHRKRSVPKGQREKEKKPRYDRKERHIWYY